MTDSAHHRRLERMYHQANCNRHYRPRLAVDDGAAEVRIPVREELYHAAHALHGSTYFKVLDDAAFFAAQSRVKDVFVVTASFQLDLLRPVTEGEIVGRGALVHEGGNRFIAAAEALDSKGRLVGRGTGTMMRSPIKLGPDVGYGDP